MVIVPSNPGASFTVFWFSGFFVTWNQFGASPLVYRASGTLYDTGLGGARVGLSFFVM